MSMGALEAERFNNLFFFFFFKSIKKELGLSISFSYFFFFCMQFIRVTENLGSFESIMMWFRLRECLFNSGL